MVHNAVLGTQNFEEIQVAAEGHGPYAAAVKVKPDQGSLAAGQILALNAAEQLIPYQSETLDLGTGGAAATAVTGEVLGAGDGTTQRFSAYLANLPVGGSVTIGFTVGASPLTVDVGADGVVDVAEAVGFVDHETGYVDILFTTAPDNSTNVTADYEHTPPETAFSGTFTTKRLMPGTVTVTDGSGFQSADLAG